MKKMVLGIVLTLASLGLMSAPVMAAAGSQPAVPVLSASDQAFLAALATPTSDLAAKSPAIVGKDACTATVNCGGTSVSCTGTTASGCTGVPRNCAALEPGHVTCNGVTTSCPACPCSDYQAQCAANCGSCPIQTFQCSPYVCLCNRRSGPCT